MNSKPGIGVIPWFVLGTLMVLLPFLFFKSNSIDYESHAQFLHDIARLKELNVTLNEDMIKTRFGLLPNYDKLVTAGIAVTTASTILQKRIALENNRPLNQAWDIYINHLTAKQSLIENFKSHNAILRNSVRYLPLITREFELENQQASGSREHAKAIRSLLEKTLILNLDQGFEHLVGIEGLLKTIKAGSQDIPNRARPAYEDIILHSQTILTFKKAVDELINGVYVIPIKASIENVLATYFTKFNAHQKTVDMYRTGVFVVAAFLIILVTFVLYRLSVARNRLDESVTKLNFQKFALDQHAIVSIADVKGNISYVNEKFCAISGYTSDELIGRNHRIVKSDEHDKATFKGMWKTISGGKVWHGEIKNVAKDGSHYWVRSTIVPFLNKNNKPFQYVSIRTDITNHKNMEVDLVHTKDLAVKANQSKSEFLANMSHEIRTPMNAIIGLSHLALQTDLSVKQYDYVSKILSSSTTLLQIINDILDFSKIEAGKLSMERIPFKIDTVIDQVCSVISQKADEKGIDVYISRPPGIPMHLIGDPLRLGQILTNLANNAVKFTDTGDIVIALEETNRFLGHVQLRISVKDTGIGLSDAAQKKLFSSFSQADTSTTRKYGGTGLGLAISKSLVELMGGTIGVDSEQGTGSTFYFTTDFEISEEQAVPAAGKNLGIKGLKVLVTDDKEVARTIFSQILKGFGMTVKTVKTADKAVQELQSACHKGVPYDVAIFDWKMPGLDGIEASRIIALEPLISPKPHFILVTAHGREEALKEAKGMASFEILTKPISPSTMFDAVQHAMDTAFYAKVNTHHDLLSDDTALQSILGAKILIVEDTPMNQQVAQEFLENFGLITTIANEGAEALEILKTHDFDAILMDIQMPVMDGIEATKAIRKMKKYKGLPIIAMTAHAMKEERDRCLRVGMNDHIAKPIDPDILFRTLLKWIKPAQRDHTPKPNIRKFTPPDLLPAPIDGINFEVGLRHTSNNQTLYVDLLRQFKITQADCVSDLIHELHTENSPAALRRIHTLKGIAGMIGAERLALTATTLDLKLQAGPDSDYATALTEFSAQMDRVLNGLQVLIEEPRPPAQETTLTKVDLSQVQTHIDQLMGLLQNADLDSLQIAHELSTNLNATPHGDMVKVLVTNLEQFDFAKAERTLNDLTERLSKPP